MQLNIDHSYNKNVITPFQQTDRVYHVLFLRNSDGPFFVRDAASTAKLTTLIRIGEIYMKPDARTIRVVGNIFFTSSKVMCEGSYLLAYSGVFHEHAQRNIPSDFNMELLLKTKGFHLFNQKNRATLVVSPTLKQSIKANLEI